MRLRTILGALAVAAVGVPSASAVVVTGDENAQTTYLQDKTVITVTQSGKLYVTEPGEIELLVVGGGGGGGKVASGQDSSTQGGGGGGGGVIYKESFAVAVGSYDVTIGAGGPANIGNAATMVNGGTTEVFDLKAYGGGYGAMSLAFTVAGTGASGGGNSKDWKGNNKGGGGVSQAAKDAGNLGNAGALGVGAYNGGGGGGAGSPGNGNAGGDGFPCSITGQEVYYAGGGGGGGADGLGGGNANYGGGGHRSQTGGNGVVIVSFVRTAGTDSDDFALAGGNRKYLCLDGTALAFTENGSLTVTGDGFVDILLVGGGGGGGESVTDNSGNACSGGGGGAGGFVYRRNVPLSAGTYPVTVGLGGVMNSNAKTESMGGNSTILGLTAWGGGFGAKGQGFTPSTSGGSGGGGSVGWPADTTKKPGSAAAHTGAPDFNLANAGGDCSGSYTPGGGGGAGAAGAAGTGGAGLPCDITGEEVYYAGGGGYHNGGIGGGGKSGTPGTDGLGGGGGSGAKGGKGVVIVRFRKADYETCFADATGGKITHCRDAERKRYTVHTFTQNGTFSLPHAGLVEFLLVGGGGAGGAACPNIDYSYGGGGGAGGVIHKTSYILEAGDHPIVIGAGGIVTQGTDATANGGNTTAFDLTAWGGGCGAKGGGFTTAGTGASGGGGTCGFQRIPMMPGRDPNPACIGNLGNRGGDPGDVYASGGGGGAGGAGDSAGNGGVGYACGITGAEIYYAGGGNGNKGATTPAQGSGNTCFGGGGQCGKNGGAGVVIVRYLSPDTGMAIIIK